MRNTTSRFIAFFDECGDHSMEKIDHDFPLFVLSTVIFERSVYVEKAVPALAKLKLDFWNHEGINLHSRDIRMAQGDFSFLQNSLKRQQFMDALSSMMSELDFTLFVTAIDKIKHKERYGSKAINPYDLSLRYSFERVLHFLESKKETALPVIAESRGRNEDVELGEAFCNLMTRGTNFVFAERFQKLQCPLTFRRKNDNIAGVQIADLCAYPSARKILNPDRPNKSFEIISSKFFDDENIRGLKTFP